MNTHKRPRQFGDHTRCMHCDKSWDTNDAHPPECSEYDFHPDPIDIKRGDLLHCPDGSYTVMRVDHKEQEVICMKDMKSYTINFITFDYGMALHEPKHRPTVRPLREGEGTGAPYRPEWT